MNIGKVHEVELIESFNREMKWSYKLMNNYNDDTGENTKEHHPKLTTIS